MGPLVGLGAVSGCIFLATLGAMCGIIAWYRRSSGSKVPPVDVKSHLDANGEITSPIFVNCPAPLQEFIESHVGLGAPFNGQDWNQGAQHTSRFNDERLLWIEQDDRLLHLAQVPQVPLSTILIVLIVALLLFSFFPFCVAFFLRASFLFIGLGLGLLIVVGVLFIRIGYDVNRYRIKSDMALCDRWFPHTHQEPPLGAKYLTFRKFFIVTTKAVLVATFWTREPSPAECEMLPTATTNFLIESAYLVRYARESDWVITKRGELTASTQRPGGTILWFRTRLGAPNVVKKILGVTKDERMGTITERHVVTTTVRPAPSHGPAVVTTSTAGTTHPAPASKDMGPPPGY